MAGVRNHDGGRSADINVVPLIDIVLVLLIIFMVVTPMMTTGVDVRLPKSEHGADKDERAATDFVVSITEDGIIWITDDVVDPGSLKAKKKNRMISEEELKERLSAMLRTNPFLPILVKGDDRATYGDIRKVVMLAENAGAKVVNIAAEGKKKA